MSTTPMPTTTQEVTAAVDLLADLMLEEDATYLEANPTGDPMHDADVAELLRAAVAFRNTARPIVARLAGDALGKVRDQ